MKSAGLVPAGQPMAHLHFEVRVGDDYTDAVNPVLWFAPLDDHDHPKTATLAGVILDRAAPAAQVLPHPGEAVANR